MKNKNASVSPTTNSNISPTAKQLAVMYAVRLGKILSNVSIICAALILSAIFSFIGMVVYYLLGFIIIVLTSIFTIGLIYISWPSMIQDIFSGSQVLSNISEWLMGIMPFSAIVCVITALLSLILLLIDKNNRSIFRIILSVIVLAIALLLVVLILFGVVAQA